MAKVFDIKDNHKVAYKQGAVLGHKKNSEGVYGAVEGTFTRDGAATRVGKTGLIESVADGVPQVDFEGGNSAYVLEPQRTNFIDYSEDFTQSTYGFSSIGTGTTPILTSNYDISPDGTQNANRIQFDIGSGSTSSDNSQFQANVTETVGVTYTTSIYLKSNDNNSYDFSMVDVAGVVSLITVTNEWKRFEMTNNATGTTTLRLRLRGNEGTSKNADILAWGVQLEEGSYATSYIPTNGTTVTRNASTLTGFGNEYLFNSSEGVLFVEMAALADDLTQRTISLSDGTTNNFIRLEFFNVSNRIRTRMYSSGVLQKTLQLNSVTIVNNNKISVRWGGGLFSLFINGVKIEEGVVSTFPLGIDRLNFDLGQGSANFYGKVKELQVYDTALTDAELIALTS